MAEMDILGKRQKLGLLKMHSLAAKKI